MRAPADRSRAFLAARASNPALATTLHARERGGLEPMPGPCQRAANRTIDTECHGKTPADTTMVARAGDEGTSQHCVVRAVIDLRAQEANTDLR